MKKLYMVNNFFKNKIFLAYIISALIFSIVVIAAISIGSVKIPFSDTVDVILNKLNLKEFYEVDNKTIIIIEKIRLPRVVLASMVGAALALCGVVVQSLLKNPLASSSTLGISSGGTLGAVIAIATGVRIEGYENFTIVIFSIVASFLSLLFIIFFSSKTDRNLSSNTIILTGIIYSMLTASFISLVLALTSEDRLKSIIFWQMGSFSGRGWDYIKLMTPFFIIFSIILIRYARELNVLAIGETQAKYLGVEVKKVKLILLLSISVLTGVSVSMVGNIAFVGLVIPHIVRTVVGSNHKVLLPFTMIYGGIFLVITDLISRIVISPAELPIGIVTSFIGSIIFVYIFYKYSRK